MVGIAFRISLDALYVITEVIQMLQLYPALLALGMFAEDQVAALPFLHLPQMLAIEVVVYDGWSGGRERPLLVLLTLVSDAARTPRLFHKKGEQVRPGRPSFHHDVGLHLCRNSSLLHCLSLVIWGSHKLGRLAA